MPPNLRHNIIGIAIILICGTRVTAARGQTVLDSLFASITVTDISGFPEIVIFATLRDATGRIIDVCGAEAFELNEFHAASGELRTAKNLEVTLLPTLPGTAVSVALVMDKSSSLGRSGVEQAKSAAREFVAALQPQDRAAIIAFDSRVQTLQQFTNDSALLLQAIDTLSSGGNTALYDAAIEGLAQAAGEPGNRNVILFSDGKRTAGSNDLNAVIDETRRLLIPIHTIAVGNADVAELENIAQQSNGTYRAGTLGQLGTLYTDLTRQIRSQYRLVFTSTQPQVDGQQREVQLRVNCGGLDIFANTRYSANVPLVIEPSATTRLLLDSPSAIPADSDFEVTFRIRGNPAEARLFYRTIGADVFTELTLLPLPDDVWSGIVPGDQVGAPGLELYVVATNAEGAARSFPVASLEPSLRPPQVLVGMTGGPVVTVDAPPGVEAEPLIVQARVLEGDNPIRDVLLFFRPAGRREFRVQPMVSSGSQEYAATIDAAVVKEPGMEIAVLATDTAEVRGSYGRLFTPAFVTVVPASPPPALASPGNCGLGAMGGAFLAVGALFVGGARRRPRGIIGAGAQRDRARRAFVSTLISIVVTTTLLGADCGGIPSPLCNLRAGLLPQSGRIVQTLDVPRDGAVTITMTSEDFDPFLELHTADRELIESDDDSGTGDAAQIDMFLQAGTYRVVARGRRSGSEGAYSLTASGGACLSTPTPLPNEADRTGTLFFDTEDLWSLSVLSQTRIQVTLAAGDFEVIGQVLDDRMQEVIEDRRGNEVLLQGVLEPGSYLIRCSARNTNAGPYSMNVFLADAASVNLAARASVADRS